MWVSLARSDLLGRLAHSGSRLVRSELLYRSTYTCDCTHAQNNVNSVSCNCTLDQQRASGGGGRLGAAGPSPRDTVQDTIQGGTSSSQLADSSLQQHPSTPASQSPSFTAPSPGLMPSPVMTPSPSPQAPAPHFTPTVHHQVGEPSREASHPHANVADQKNLLLAARRKVNKGILKKEKIANRFKFSTISDTGTNEIHFDITNGSIIPDQPDEQLSKDLEAWLVSDETTHFERKHKGEETRVGNGEEQGGSANQPQQILLTQQGNGTGEKQRASDGNALRNEQDHQRDGDEETGGRGGPDSSSTGDSAAEAAAGGAAGATAGEADANARPEQRGNGTAGKTPQRALSGIRSYHQTPRGRDSAAEAGDRRSARISWTAVNKRVNDGFLNQEIREHVKGQRIKYYWTTGKHKILFQVDRGSITIKETQLDDEETQLDDDQLIEKLKTWITSDANTHFEPNAPSSSDASP